jgi:hypothetical protein
MTTIYNNRYSKRNLVIGNFGTFSFDESGMAEVSEEAASALRGANGFTIKKEIVKEAVPKDENVSEVDQSLKQKEKLPKFNSKKMSKAWLEAFGKRVHGVDVDKRKSAATLYRILKKLEKSEQE